MIKTISFKSSGLSGDVITYLAGIKQVCNDMNAKADIYLWLDQNGFLYHGASHPYGGKMLNQYAFDMLRPLIEEQLYVNSVNVWKGETIHVDLDKIREVQSGMPYGSLARWIFYKYPDMTCDLSEPWIKVYETDLNTKTKDKILINRTSRYNNGWLNYFFMEKYKDRMVFCGLPDEHEKFQKDWCFELPLLEVRHFYELAFAIASCKFFIGNQSMCFAIAEALKVPRILEVCDFAPNVIPIGKHAYDVRFQEALTFLVDKLDKEL